MSVTITHGDKGGVGKSVVAIAYGEYVLARERSLCVIDADLRNSDVYRYFSPIEGVETHRLDLRSEAGWISFYDLLERVTAGEVLVSLPGNIGAHVGSEAENMIYAFPESGRSGKILFVINTEADSINLLRQALEAYRSDVPIVAVMNEHFGIDFGLWEGSKTRTALLESGGKETRFPDLGALVSLTLKAAAPTRIIGGPGVSLGQRTKIRHFLKASAAAFKSIEAFE